MIFSACGDKPFPDWGITGDRKSTQVCTSSLFWAVVLDSVLNSYMICEGLKYLELLNSKEIFMQMTENKHRPKSPNDAISKMTLFGVQHWLLLPRHNLINCSILQGEKKSFQICFEFNFL